ncbi:MAG: NADH-quinone oxidoreductase subunit A [Opitutales bacterium]
MINPFEEHLLYLIAYGLVGLGFALAPILIAHLLMAKGSRQTMSRVGQFVECGAEPIGDAWIRYSAVYYLYALVFVAFAVAVIYLIPVAVIYDRVFPWRDLVGLFVFLGILSLVIVYAWSKGVFEWIRRPPPVQQAKKDVL